MGAPGSSPRPTPPPVASGEEFPYDPPGTERVAPSDPLPFFVPPSTPPPIPPPPSHRRLWIVVGAVAVVVVIVLAIVLATGMFSPHSGGPTGPEGPPLSYVQVVSAALSVGATEAGGPWTLVVAEGIGLTNAVSAPNLGGTFGSGCSASLVSGAPTTYTVDATPSNAIPGEVSGWLFIAANAYTGALLMIGVNASSAVPLGLISGCSTVSQFLTMGTITGLPVVNETAVAASFDQQGGTSFLADHTVGYRAFVLLGSSSQYNGQAVWAVIYTTCVVLASGGTGTSIVAAYTAATGVSIVPPTQEATTC